MFRWASFDFGALFGLHLTFDSSAGADCHQPFGFDIALVLTDDDCPFGECFPELGFAVFDHVQPVQKDTLAASCAVGLSAQNSHIGFELVDSFQPVIPSTSFILKFFQGDVSTQLDLV